MMLPYLQLYLDFFGYTFQNEIVSELSGQQANHVHHISCKGKGGSKEKDFIENLIALTFTEHDQKGDKKQYMVELYIRHVYFIKKHRPDYEIQWQRIPLEYRADVQNHFVPKESNEVTKEFNTIIAPFNFRCSATGIFVKKGNACLKDNDNKYYSNQILKVL